MRVGGQRAGDAQTVGAGLLLGDAPLTARLALQGKILADEFGPLNTSSYFNRARLGVKVEYLA